MKIAQIVCVYPPYKGGIGNVCQNFALNLKNLGHEVTVFTPDYHQKNQIKHEVDIEKIKIFGRAEIVWLYKKINKKNKLVIHYHMDVFDLSDLARILSIPSKLIFNSLFDMADAITCASKDYIKNSSIKGIYKEHENKFYEIPFGVDLDKFRVQKNKKTENTKKILFVGGLDRAHYFKGLSVLFKALADIKLDGFGWGLDVVGSGNFKNKYRRETEELGIGNNVCFLGDISNDALPDIYNQADLLILPSIDKSEAFGLVLLEAMASGVPVIASSLPGVRTVFEDGRQGFFAAPGDKKDLKNKIIKILENDKLIMEMGERGRILVEEKYNWMLIAKKLENLYEGLCYK